MEDSVKPGPAHVDQIATHRAAGLDVTFGLQYLAQLGSGSEHQQKIRKGIVNLLQSRFLFRLGDHEDAEEATRIAMAVYSTMIRDDPDSRARMRVTPEQILNLPVHYCLASWIAGGTRAASFIGQTFPFPNPIADTWAQVHLERLQATVGPYPETLASTLERTAPTAKDELTAGTTIVAQPRDPAAPEPTPPPPAPERREPRIDRQFPTVRPNLAQSPVRRVVGRPIANADSQEPQRPAPASVRELAFIDRINEVREPEQLQPGEKPPRLYDTDYAIFALLDRAGLVLPSLIGRAVLPGKEARTVRHRLNKLYEHGLIARAGVGISGRSSADGRLPWLYTLTRHGHEIAQTRNPPAIHPNREWRALEQRRALTLPHTPPRAGLGD